MGNMFGVENYTVVGTSISYLHCPSDPSVENKVNLGGVVSSCATQAMEAAGTWFNLPRFNTDDVLGPGNFQQRIMQQNGVILYVGYESSLYVGGQLYPNKNRGPVRLAAVTDGTSNTMMYSERAHGMLSAQDQICWNWWCSGNFGDTSFATMYPMNPFKKDRQPRISAGYGGGADAFVGTASSFHPGGANFLFCDGSVRFLKDSIQSWQFDPSNRLSQGRAHGRHGRLAGRERNPVRYLSGSVHDCRWRGRQL